MASAMIDSAKGLSADIGALLQQSDAVERGAKIVPIGGSDILEVGARVYVQINACDRGVRYSRGGRLFAGVSLGDSILFTLIRSVDVCASCPVLGMRNTNNSITASL